MPTWRGPRTPPLCQMCLPPGCQQFRLEEKTKADVSRGGCEESEVLQFHSIPVSRKALSLLHSLTHKCLLSDSGNYCSVHLQAINTRDPARTLRAISSNMGIESREVKFYERWLYIAHGANRRSCTPGDLLCHLPRSCCAYCSVGFSVHTAPRNAIRPIAHSGQFRLAD